MHEDSGIRFNSFHIHRDGKLYISQSQIICLPTFNLPLPLVNQNLEMTAGG